LGVCIARVVVSTWGVTYIYIGVFITSFIGSYLGVYVASILVT